MTSRRDAVLALAGIAALPLFRTLGAEELVEVGRRAHSLAELRESGAPRALTAAEYALVSEAAERIIPRTATPGATDARVELRYGARDRPLHRVAVDITDLGESP